MRILTRALMITLVSMMALASLAWAADSVPLGSADFVPSAERPLGWRGDGTGLYPGANPPLVWSRRVTGSAVTNAGYQARKPANDAAPAAGEAKPLELGIVKDWLVLGPFAADDAVKDIDKEFIPDEATVAPNENDKVGTLAWKALHTSIDTQSTHYTNEGTCEDFNVDFVFLYGRVNNQVAYGHTYIYSPTGGSAKLSLRHFNAAGKIWLNGKPTVLKPKDYNDVYGVNVTLNKGWNRLLVKLSAAESTRPEGQNAWISKWRFAAYLSATLPAKYETKNIAWMAKLPGFSASSPVIAGDRIFATCGTSDLVCVNKKDGRILWLTTCTPCDAATAAEKEAAGYKEKVEPLAASLKTADEALVGELNSLSALQGLAQDRQSKVDGLIRQKHDLERKLHDALKAIDAKKYVPLYVNEVSASNGTPCTDGQRVYAVMGGGSKGPGAYLFAAYTLDGKHVWSYHEALGAAEHGNHTSPALVDGKLIYGNMGLLIAFDAATGKVAWRNTLAKDSPHFWDVGGLVACTFVPYRVAGAAMLVAAPGRIVRVADGQVVAQSKNDLYFGGLTAPVLVGGWLYSDGGKAFQAVQLPASADGGARLGWKLEPKQWRMEASSDFSIASGIAAKGVYYSIDTMGGLTAIDLAGQKPLYMRRLEMYQRANRQIFGFTASPALGGRYIDIFDNTGCAVVLEPGAQYKEAGRNIIENQVASDWQEYKQEMFYAAPVFDGAALYLKGSEYLYCIREKQDAAAEKKWSYRSQVMKHSWNLSYVALFLALSACTTAWPAEPAAPVPLGSPDFRPSLERPIGWRGDGSGCYPGATPPTEWSVKPKKNIRWSTTVGSSFSSPIVTDRFVFVTSEPDVLICVDRADGKVKWKMEVKPSELTDEKNRKAAEEYETPQVGAGYAAATPVTDGTKVYVVFANGIVRAVDMDGKTQWTAYIDAEQSSEYGRSSSPVIVAGKLIVHMTNLYALDPATGKELWKNTDARSTYGTPTGFKVGEVTLIATPAGDIVRADDGTIVKAGIASSSNPSPVVKDGVVYFGDKSVAAVRLGAAFKPENLWQGDITGESQADNEVFGSPLLHNDLLFILNGPGKLFAFDAKGKGTQDPVIAARPLFDDGGGGGNPLTYSCITLAGNYLFVNTTKGDQVVLEPTREAKEVKRNTLPDGSGSTPTFSGNDMFIRDGEKLFCISQPAK